jgi:hypothetical protein
MEELMPELLPKTMESLMPNLLPLLVPYVAPMMIEYIKTGQIPTDSVNAEIAATKDNK